MRSKRILIAAVITCTACAAILAVLEFGVGSPAASAAGPAYQRMDTTPAPGSAKLSHAAQVVDGQPWSLTSFTNTDGQLCAGEKVPNDGGDGGQGLACRDQATLFANGPLVYFVGARQLPGDLAHWANAWVWGFASPQVARLDLQLTNCNTVPVTIDSQGLFFHVLDRGSIRGGVGPQALLAYGADGTLLAKQATPLTAPGSPQARAAGATAPVPGSC